MLFATDDWAQALRAELEGSASYRKAASGWTHGPIALVVRAAPALGLHTATGLWLDIDSGRCRAARIVSDREAGQAPFCITGEYRDWKSVVKRQLDPMKAVVSRKLQLRGSLFTLLRYVPAAMELVGSAQRVRTEFHDEARAVT